MRATLRHQHHHLNHSSGWETADLNIWTFLLPSPKIRVCSYRFPSDSLNLKLVVVSSKADLAIVNENTNLYSLCAVNVQTSTGFEEVEEVAMRFRRLLMRMMIVGALSRRLGWSKTSAELQESHGEERLSSQGVRETTVNVGSVTSLGACNGSSCCLAEYTSEVNEGPNTM